MRVLLAFLLFTNLLLAQETFGPTALMRNQLCYSPRIYLRPQQELLCMWSPTEDDVYPALASRISPSGSILEPPQRYDAICRSDFSCSADMDIVPTPSGGEAWLMGHT